MNVIQQIEAEHAARLPGAKMPPFQPGDTIIVNVKVAEGERTRVQAYEGVCIARSGHGLNENFTVRKISYGEGVERVFPVYSPMMTRSKSCGAARSGAPSSIICAIAAASRPASPNAWTRPASRPPPPRRPPRNNAGRERGARLSPRQVGGSQQQSNGGCYEQGALSGVLLRWRAPPAVAAPS